MQGPELSSQQPLLAGDSAEARDLRDHLIDGMVYEIRDARVLEAMRRVPRHLFTPTHGLRSAYADLPLPIGYGQTISQPLVVADMSAALDLTGAERVLEIGTGSGYQAAVLSLLAAEVFTLEVVPELGVLAKDRLLALGYANVHVRVGDGFLGWPDAAPFDRIVLTAAPEDVPRVLFDQLADGGVLVAPVGERWGYQRLLRYKKTGGALSVENLGGVSFVPMVPGS
jgi:protein-L-isoaspartate(D-aspartate) O-methyltransferase